MRFIFMLFAFAILVAPSPAQINFLNPGAETGTGGNPDGNNPPPSWDVLRNLTTVEYGTGGPTWPDANTPGPTNRGNNYFGGGTNQGNSYATQVFDLATYDAAIDGGGMTFKLSGWLGGHTTYGDYAKVSLQFLSAAGTPVGGISFIGPVTLADRAGQTALLYRETTDVVPVGARQAEIKIWCLWQAIAYQNMSFVDEIAFELSNSNGLVLSADKPANAGTKHHLIVFGATPGGYVRFASSTTGAGPTFYYGMDVDLSAPITDHGKVKAVLGSQLNIEYNIPPSLAGTTVWLQCFDMQTGRLSNNIELYIH